VFIIFAKEEKENKLLKQMRILSEIRTSLLNDEIAKEICRENDIGVWFLKSVPISFSKLDVAAKTADGSILLGEKLMDKPHEIRMRYVIHELVHAIQHVEDFGEKEDDKAQDYLDRDDEIEAFQMQNKYDAEQRGEEKVEEYVDGLLSHHNIPKSKREEKKDELMMEVD
jgi:hypothetical protein